MSPCWEKRRIDLEACVVGYGAGAVAAQDRKDRDLLPVPNKPCGVSVEVKQHVDLLSSP